MADTKFKRNVTKPFVLQNNRHLHVVASAGKKRYSDALHYIRMVRAKRMGLAGYLASMRTWKEDLGRKARRKETCRKKEMKVAEQC